MRRCLLIDDSPLIRKVARLVFEQQRYTVLEAENAADALGHCEEMPELILLDWHLPGSNSLDLLKQLKAVAGTARPYIIYLTTENDPLDISRAMQAGCDDVMMKPFTRADLEAKLDSLPLAA